MPLWTTSSPLMARQCWRRLALPSADAQPTPAGTKPATKRATENRVAPDNPVNDRPWQSGIPLLLAIPACLALLFLILPLVGLLVRAPWSEVAAVLTSPGALQAL